MHNLPFDKPGRFWKGNLHTHTSKSDGGLDVDEVITAYRRQGYDFLAITDHYMERFGYPIIATERFRDSEFTTLIGAELHAPALAHGEPWHLLAVGLPLDFPRPEPDDDGATIARRAAQTGAYVAIAHPSWYSLTLSDAMSIDVAHAVEVYNHTAHHHNDRGDSWGIADQLLMAGRKVHAIATDDAHFTTRPDYFGGWVHVRSESLDPDSLLAALKEGHFYASQGPAIHGVHIAADEILIETSPVRTVFLTGPGSRCRHQRGDRLTSVSFPRQPFSGSYCRVTAVDDWGRRAWTNPIWLEE